MGRASLGSIREGVSFEIEIDASDNALAAGLSQCGQPVAFMSRTISHCEKRYLTIEKKATAVIEAVRKWQHYIKGRLLTIVTYEVVLGSFWLMFLGLVVQVFC